MLWTIFALSAGGLVALLAALIVQRLLGVLPGTGGRRPPGAAGRDAIAAGSWFLVGNVVRYRETGEDKSLRHGTRHFRPGALLYCFPPQWGDGFERVVVAGLSRRGRWISVVMPSRFITNWRAKQVHQPAALACLAEAPRGRLAWGSKAEVLRMVESLREHQRAKPLGPCNEAVADGMERARLLLQRHFGAMREAVGSQWPEARMRSGSFSKDDLLMRSHFRVALVARREAPDDVVVGASCLRRGDVLELSAEVRSRAGGDVLEGPRAELALTGPDVVAAGFDSWLAELDAFLTAAGVGLVTTLRNETPAGGDLPS